MLIPCSPWPESLCEADMKVTVTLTGSIWGTKALQCSFSGWRTALMSQTPTIHGLHVTYTSARPVQGWPAAPTASARVAVAGRAQRSLVSAGTCCCLLPTPDLAGLGAPGSPSTVGHQQ